ncbi:MAG: FAD-binding oxidoreductase [Candidatus Helarchaeota archaeon]
MKIDKKILNEIQDIVGKENATDNEVILESYTYNWCVEFINVMEGNEPIPFWHKPIAVVLPSTTEEVQKFVKLCNKYHLKFKAQSTGLGPWNQPSEDDVIVVDLRRMNKIVKIDPKNMYCVVEPYVTGAQLQAELLKYGLNCHMPGAGPQVSPLASSTSMCGPGFTSSSTGFSGRNVLGTEWVLPTGEILRLGSLSLKENSDWFHGDGPGPSLRGIMRGFIGTKSGLGIFTRVAIKLFPFPCNIKQLEIKNIIPNYDFDIPNYMQFHLISCKNYETLELAFDRIEKEGITFMCFHTSTYGLHTIFSNTQEELMNRAMASPRIKNPLVVLITANTKREFEYKEKVFKAAIEELKVKDVVATGKYIPPNIAYAEALRSALGMHGFLATGAFQSTHGPMDTSRLCRVLMERNLPLKKEYIDKGLIGNDEGKGNWSTSYEHGHFYHMETPTMYDQTKVESVEGFVEYLDRCNKLDLVEHLGIPFFIEGDKMHDWYGPQCSNYHIWLRKIKTKFDPNFVADSGFYISPEKEENKTT